MLSINTFMRMHPVQHAHGDKKKRRARALAQLVSGYDVVALQEAWAHRRLLLAGFEHVAGPPLAKGVPYDGGLVIASRIPFAQPPHQRAFVGGAAHADALSAKGLLHVQLLTQPPVHIVNVHLQSLYYAPESHAGNAAARDVQAVQMEQVAEFVAGLLPGVVLLVGDFNHEGPRVAGLFRSCVAQQPTLVATFDPVSGKEVRTTTRMCAQCAQAAEARKERHVHLCVDHALTNADVESARVVPASFASDHDGVEVVLDLDRV
jgi:endonuclease/exonuclease/phosphatase family metal-dependent hydrolase